MCYINNMTQRSCNFKDQSKIVRTGGIPLWGEGPEPSQAATHSVPPPHLFAKRRVLRADFPRGEAKSAKKRPRGNSPWRLATLRGEGGVICGLIQFDNGSSDRRQIQHEDGQCHSLPFLFRQDLSNSYW
jgi:hypothetical protein